MRKVPGVRAVEFSAYHDTGHAELVAGTCLGMRNIRRIKRRGLVGTRPDARDDRGIAAVPRFGDLHDAWDVLNYFADPERCQKELAKLFFLLIDDGFAHYDKSAAAVAGAIMDSAITALEHGQQRGWL